MIILIKLFIVAILVTGSIYFVEMSGVLLWLEKKLDIKPEYKEVFNISLYILLVFLILLMLYFLN